MTLPSPRNYCVNIMVSSCSTSAARSLKLSCSGIFQLGCETKLAKPPEGKRVWGLGVNLGFMGPGRVRLRI